MHPADQDIADVQIAHDTIIERFVSTCRHCKKGPLEHLDGTDDAAGKCIFDSTAWEEMPIDEWVTWCKSLWLELSSIGTEFIRDQLKQSGLASRIKQDLFVYGNAVVEAKADPGGLKVTRIQPWLDVALDENK